MSETPLSNAFSDYPECPDTAKKYGCEPGAEKNGMKVLTFTLIHGNYQLQVQIGKVRQWIPLAEWITPVK